MSSSILKTGNGKLWRNIFSARRKPLGISERQRCTPYRNALHGKGKSW